MFFVIICFFVCVNILDLTTRTEIKSLLLRIHPLDYVGIIIKKGIGTFFPNKTYFKNILIDVDSENSDGDIITYKSFNSDDNLKAVIFQSKNYILRIINEGYNTTDFPLMFSKDFNLDINDFYIHYSFSKLNRFSKNETFDTLSSPFITSNDKNHEKSPYWISILFGYIYLLLSLCCIECNCKCCKKKKDAPPIVP